MWEFTLPYYWGNIYPNFSPRFVMLFPAFSAQAYSHIYI